MPAKPSSALQRGVARRSGLVEYLAVAYTVLVTYAAPKDFSSDWQSHSVGVGNGVPTESSPQRPSPAA